MTMRAIQLYAAVAAASLGLAGCATLQTGRGQLSAPGQHVALAWQSRNGLTGTMSATMPDGLTYSGPFFQLTSATQSEVLGPPWGWYGWGPWPATQFIIHYSGKVVANLRATNGSEMRCTFRLAQPMGGMAGGGDGSCQVTGGTVFHAFLPPRHAR